MAQKGTCAVCFGQFLIVGGSIARHGFSVVTQGYSRGYGNWWHTGPCAGYSFPPYEQSKKGTEWALERVRKATEDTHAELKKLGKKGERPVEYSHEVYLGGGRSETRTVTIRPGDRYDSIRGLPDYVTAWRQAQDRLETRLVGLSENEALYEQKIRDWEPAELVEVAAEAKGPTLHAPAPWKGRDERYIGPLCQQWAMRPPRGHLAKRPEEVTCVRCKKAMEKKPGATKFPGLSGLGNAKRYGW